MEANGEKERTVKRRKERRVKSRNIFKDREEEPEEKEKKEDNETHLRLKGRRNRI